LRRIAFLGVTAALALAAACGGPGAAGPPAAKKSATKPGTVVGAYDNETLKTQASCGEVGLTVVIVLSAGSGHEIAQQRSSMTWRDGMCMFPFSFGHLRPMSSYLIRIGGLTPDAVLTPRQIAHPALLSVSDGHYVGVLKVSGSR
jgi:hypothetical protein